MDTNDHQRDSRQIEADIEHTRENMSETLDEIQSRLSPGRLLDQTLDYFSGKSSDDNSFATNLAETVKQNPVPTTLIGLGLGWLLISGKRDAPRHSSAGTNPYASDRPAYPTNTNADYMADTVMLDAHGTPVSRSASDQYKDKAGSAVDNAKNKMGSVVDSTKEKYSAARDSVKHQAHYQTERVQQNFSYILSEQPLVLIGAGLAVGAALGAGLPPTRREDKWMGEARDNLVDEAAIRGNKQLEKVKAAADSAVEAASGSADEEGMTPDAGKNKTEEVANSARKIAHEGKEAAKQEADKQGLSS